MIPERHVPVYFRPSHILQVFAREPETDVNERLTARKVYSQADYNIVKEEVKRRKRIK
jgi:hypothetical protein